MDHKTARRLCFTLAFLLHISPSLAYSDVIYSDDFSGPGAPVALDGFAPDVRQLNAQWMAKTAIYADGSCDTGHSTAWLPNDFEEDQVYTITLGMDVLYASGSTTPAGGLALSTATTFNTGRPNGPDTRGFIEFGRSGSWAFYDVGSEPAIASGSHGSLFTSTQSDYEAKLVLTTSSTSPWKLDCFFGGVQMDLAPLDSETMSYDYPTDPVLSGTGLYIVSKTSVLKQFKVTGSLPPATVESASRVVDVFFLAGQSNMSGRVSTGYAYDPRDDGALYYYRADGPAASDVDSGGDFTSVQPLASGYYGPEISLARGLVDKGYRVAIIKVSDGGTSLDTDWNTATYGRWWKNWRSEVSYALKQLEAKGYVVRLRGFLWLQGETDADKAAMAANYEVNFTNLCASVDVELTAWGYDVSGMQKVSGFIRSASGSDANRVRTAQQNVMEAMIGGSWFDTDDLTVQDSLHYDATGISVVGERFAAAFPSIEDFDDWISAHGLSGEDALPSADPDGNGFDNLTEYSLEIEHGGVLAEPIVNMLESVLSVSSPLVRQDVVYLPQWSENLVNWYSSDLSIQRSMNFLVAQKSLSGYDQLFMRLSMKLESAESGN